MSKNRKKLLWLIGCCLIVGTVAIVILVKSLPWISPYTTSDLVVSWESSGKPLTVEGTVLDQSGNPIQGLGIDPVTTSGGNLTHTDNEGKFHVNVGEPELIELQIGEIDTLYWPTDYGLSTEKGIRFSIVLKERVIAK